MYRSILVPFANWHSDMSALLVAVSLARRSAARLHIVHVRRGRRSARALEAEDRALGAAVDWAADELDESVSFEMIPNRVAGAGADTVAARLAQYAAAHGIDLVVLSHRRHNVNRVLFGSVGTQLRQNFGIAYLFVPAGSLNIVRRSCRMLAVLDGTRVTEEVLHDAVELTRLTGGSITLVRVLDPNDVQGDRSEEASVLRDSEAEAYLVVVARELRLLGVTVKTAVLKGDTFTVLRQAAESLQADIIALTSGAGAPVYGSDGLVTRLMKPFDRALLVRPGTNEVEQDTAPTTDTALSAARIEPAGMACRI